MKIDIITGSRAEYGIMRNLIKKINEDSYFDLRIIVTGMHLEEKYGLTKNVIKNDGYKIYAEIDSQMNDSTESGIINSLICTMMGFKKIYENDKPDCVLILGDRYEIYGVAQVCALYQIPIVHLHGGEKTEGNFDEFIRHSITKMSNLHFVATEEFRNRVIQLGEDPKSVYNVGALGVENIETSTMLDVDQLNDKLKMKIDANQYVVVAYHPETLIKNHSNEQLLRACEKIIKEYKIIFIGTNSDTNADVFMENMKSFVDKHSGNSYLFTSLHPLEYYSVIKHAKVFIGNSSSGLIEVPSLDTITINIGARQQGRVRGTTVYDVENDERLILNTFELVKEKQCPKDNPYGKKDTSDNIIKIIKENTDKLNGVVKVFHDIEFKESNE